MVFIGYERGSKGYKAYDPSTGSIHLTREVVFEENCAWNWENFTEFKEGYLM